MVIKATVNLPIEGELDELIRGFSPTVELGEVANIDLNITMGEGGVNATLTDEKGETLRFLEGQWRWNVVKERSEIKKFIKVILYDYISQKSGIDLPYGSLTGIRPTKLYHELIEKNLNAKDYFIDNFKVSKEATEWVEEIVNNQSGSYNKCESEIDLFINIPICVTRCSYCSFISAELKRVKHLLPSYIDQLKEEIEQALEIICNNDYKLRAIYVGGGTPTSLKADELQVILQPLKGIECLEFTVEAGRPDTITPEKLQVMKDCGVTRISINPQTFNDETLKLIGRSHTAQEIYQVYNIAKTYGMDINMDLIAMLPSENLEVFKDSLLKAIELFPQNITVHTLAIKRGSNLKLSNHDNTEGELAQQMINFSKKALTKHGYKPYYMYRQKYMSGNLENTGYTREGYACVYNIDIMEETHSIIACGAGGISKRVFHNEDRLERLANPKGIDIYLERKESIAMQKILFFAKE